MYSDLRTFSKFPRVSFFQSNQLLINKNLPILIEKHLKQVLKSENWKLGPINFANKSPTSYIRGTLEVFPVNYDGFCHFLKLWRTRKKGERSKARKKRARNVMTKSKYNVSSLHWKLCGGALGNINFLVPRAESRKGVFLPCVFLEKRVFFTPCVPRKGKFYNMFS
jgi:hypothetical protein